jgi:hypothetical protein
MDENKQTIPRVGLNMNAIPNYGDNKTEQF